MTEKTSVFRETYAHYLEKIRTVNLTDAAAVLGGESTGGALCIPYFDRHFTVTPDGVTDEKGRRAPFDACIVLFKYILMCPSRPSDPGPWTAFREFKDAAPLVHYFAANAERAVAAAFSGRIEALRGASGALSGRASEEPLPYDHSAVFDALPRIPLLLLFNDAEEGFAADCSILFRSSAADYLDMECAGILGAQLAGYLSSAAD